MGRGEVARGQQEEITGAGALEELVAAREANLVMMSQHELGEKRGRQRLELEELVVAREGSLVTLS